MLLDQAWPMKGAVAVALLWCQVGRVCLLTEAKGGWGYAGRIVSALPMFTFRLRICAGRVYLLRIVCFVGLSIANMFPHDVVLVSCLAPIRLLAIYISCHRISEKRQSMSGLRCGHPAPGKGSEVEAQDLHGVQVGAMGPCLTA